MRDLSNRLGALLKSGDLDTGSIKSIKALLSTIQTIEDESINKDVIDAIKFEHIFDVTHDDFDESFIYNEDGSIKSKYYYQKGDSYILWRLDFGYINGNLSTKDIMSFELEKTLRITYIYENGNLSKKEREWL